jgi:hypothetical protein
MKIEELAAFIKSHGVGRYCVRVLPTGECIATPLTDNQIIVDPEVMAEIIAAKECKSGSF